MFNRQYNDLDRIFDLWCNVPISGFDVDTFHWKSLEK